MSPRFQHASSWAGGFFRADRPQSSSRLIALTLALCMVGLTLAIMVLVMFTPITAETHNIVMEIGVPLAALGASSFGALKARSPGASDPAPLAAQDASTGAGARTATD